MTDPNETAERRRTRLLEAALRWAIGWRVDPTCACPGCGAARAIVALCDLEARRPPGPDEPGSCATCGDAEALPPGAACVCGGARTMRAELEGLRERALARAAGRIRAVGA